MPSPRERGSEGARERGSEGGREGESRAHTHTHRARGGVSVARKSNRRNGVHAQARRAVHAQVDEEGGTRAGGGIRGRRDASR
eukprot:3939881-Rhodomonas_salina.1